MQGIYAVHHRGHLGLCPHRELCQGFSSRTVPVTGPGLLLGTDPWPALSTQVPEAGRSTPWVWALGMWRGQRPGMSWPAPTPSTALGAALSWAPCSPPVGSRCQPVCQPQLFPEDGEVHPHNEFLPMIS